MVYFFLNRKFLFYDYYIEHMKILLIIISFLTLSYGSYTLGFYFAESKNINWKQEKLMRENDTILASQTVRNVDELKQLVAEKSELSVASEQEETIEIDVLSSAIDTWEVYNLEVFKREFAIEGNSYFVFRKFVQNDVEKYLIVQDKTYKTSAIVISNINELSEYGELYENSEYKKLQDEVYALPAAGDSPLQNHGVVWKSDSEEVFLTADFCPSRKHGFEKEIFEEFIKQGHKNVWIAITSSWIAGHPNDYRWLIEKNNSLELNISWINHTKTHNYDHGVWFEHNFILTPWLDLEDEILSVEEDLLQEGQIPSVFIRYPGLISDDTTRKDTIYNYWLFPIGANAWLAKWEHPGPGSVILIHGNKNEHYGVQLMNTILQKDNFQYWSVENIFK